MYAAYFVFVFTGIQLLVVLINLVFRQKMPAVSDSGGLVSVLIPARNEEPNIGVILQALQKQHYRDMEIIVFDDQSTDRTAEIVEEFTKTDDRIKLVRSTGLPAGWLGKNFACHMLAQHAAGRFFLFLDADVLVYNDLIKRSIAFAEKHKLGLLSIFPVQLMPTAGERLTVPVMNFILLSLLPLELVRRSRFASLSAANGQFMLFDADIYKQMQPHNEVKNCKVEDIAIARFFKKKKIKVACLTGEGDVKCRMYNDFGSALNGFSKNVLSFFGGSVVLAVLFWLVTTLGIFPVMALGADKLAVYMLVVMCVHVFISMLSHQPVFKNLLLVIPRQFVLGTMLIIAIRNNIKREFQWKGRNIY